MRSNAMILLLFALFLNTGTATWGPIGMGPYRDPFGVNKYRDPFGMDMGPFGPKESDIARSCELAVGRIANKETDYDPATMQLSCRNRDHALMAIVWESKRYRALRCGISWRGVDEEEKPMSPQEIGMLMGEALRKTMDVNCAEYCAVTGSGVESSVEGDLKAKCANDGQIFINNSLVDTPRLKCAFNGGWTRDDNSGIPADTETPLQVECKMPCVQGERSEGVATIVEDGKTVVKCNKPDSDGSKYGISVNGGIAYSNFKCDKNGYKDVLNNVVFAEAYAAVKLECKIGVPCSFKPADSMVHFDDVTRTLSCNGGDKLMAIEFNSKRYKSLQCDEIDGWKNGSTVIADAFNRIPVKCVEYCSVISDKMPNTVPEVSMVHFNDATRTLSCNGGGDKMMAIEFNSKRYKYLLCDEVDGWKDGSTMLADSFNPIPVKCVESRTVSCHENPRQHTNAVRDEAFDAHLILFLNHKPTLHARSYVTCSLDHGWLESERWTVLTEDTATAARLECKRACVKTTIADGVQSTPFNDLDAFLINQLGCDKSDATNGGKYGVRINNAFVYPKIVCGAAGYTVGDASGHKLASAFEDATFECALLPTTTASTTTTTTTTTPSPTTTTVPETTTEKVEKFRPRKPLKPTRKDGENSGRKNHDDEEDHGWIKDSAPSISICSIIFIIGHRNL